MFSSLAVPNYRRYYLGQVVSRTGTLMQQFAQSWLVYDLSGSATIVGLTVALQTIPILLISPYAGLLADRLDKRRLMVVLQAMMGVLAVILGMLTVTHVVELWHVFVLALLLGVNEAFDTPSRQAFIFEMVGPDQLTNAVGLNSVLNNISRAVGPAVGAGVVATLGLGMCFLLNAASFVAVIVSLVTIDRSQLQAAPITRRAKGQLREGFGYVRRSPMLWVPLGMMALIGTLTWEFQTTLPPMASQVLHGGATAYGLMIAMQGLGAIGGGLTVAARGRAGPKLLIVQAVAFGVAMTLLAFAPNLPLALAIMVLVGFAATSFTSTANSTIQLNADPNMRGRVMSLWSMSVRGSTPVGGPLTGFVATQMGPRVAIGVGAAACFGAAVLGTLSAGRHRDEKRLDVRRTPVASPVEPDSV
jgi:MFS family permease